MASAAFTINGSSSRKVSVEPGTTVNLALANSLGADVIVWSVIGSHSSLVANPTITPAGSPAGSTASFAMPAGYGQSYRIQCQINAGKLGTQVVSDYTYTAIVGVSGVNGVLPFAAGEEFERSATHGATDDLNACLTSATSIVAASGNLDTTDASAQTIATIPTVSEYQYMVSAIASSRQNSSSNSAWHHTRFLYTNKGGTVAAQGSPSDDALGYDAITMAGLTASISSTNILVRLTGAAATTIRHSYLVEYVAMRIRTS